MGKVRVGFNGMGRIGKNVMRVIVSKLNDRFEIVAGNDLVPAADIAASLPKDAVYGRFPPPSSRPPPTRSGSATMSSPSTPKWTPPTCPGATTASTSCSSAPAST